MSSRSTLRNLSWGSVQSFSNDCLTERTQAAITQPEVIRDFLCPVDAVLSEKIRSTRTAVANILHGRENGLVVVTGPRYISSTTQTKQCSQWIELKNGGPYDLGPADLRLKNLYQPTRNNVRVLMNANVSQSKQIHQSKSTTVTQPYYLTRGLVNTRTQLLQICSFGVCLVGQIDDPISHVYFSDLFALGIVPSKQRGMVNVVSDLPYPCGFVCSTNEIEEAKQNCLKSSLDGRSYLTVKNLGQIGLATSTGNTDTFVVLTLEDLVPSQDRIDVRFMVDLGRINGSNYKTRQEQVKTIIEGYRGQLVGFVIDSGDSYTSLSTDTSATDENCNEGALIQYNAISDDLLTTVQRRSVFRSLLSNSYSRISSSLATGKFTRENGMAQFENLFYSDKLILEIDRLV